MQESSLSPFSLREAFRRRYGREPLLVRAPGRVNLIGEHTDYNDGYVMPAAIDLYTWVAAAARDDRELVLHSSNFGATSTADLDAPRPRPSHHWSDYPRGVAAALEAAGHRLRGADMLFAGEVPLGAGLSSSAAIEVATGRALLELSGGALDPVELAKLCQRAENEFVGTRCGIMDQFASCNGRSGHALMLDCRSLALRQLPIPAQVVLVICNSMVKHALAGGEYNRRRAQCEEGVALLARQLPHVRALRDVALADLEQHRGGLPEVVYRRCRHVVSENKRVLDTATALQAGDLRAVGRALAESHRSLGDDYEVSCRELDVLVDLARELPRVHGARMTGGGFGGCTINLVERSEADEFRRHITQGYSRATGHTPEIYECTAADGAERVS